MDDGVVDTVVTERRQHKMGWMANIPLPLMAEFLPYTFHGKNSDSYFGRTYKLILKFTDLYLFHFLTHKNMLHLKLNL